MGERKPQFQYSVSVKFSFPVCYSSRESFYNMLGTSVCLFLYMKS